MKKIVILGCENSHADAFLKYAKTNEDFADIEIVGIYSDESAPMERLSKIFNVPKMESYDVAAGQVDGIIITARHGDNHYKYAKPYIASGVPMFIDKPITISEKEANDFMRELSSNGVRVCGGSSLKQDEYVKKLKEYSNTEFEGKTIGGFVCAPLQMENAYGGFYFYAQHLVEMVCEIFGRFPLSVTAKQNGGQINVLFHYEEYDCIGLLCDGKYVYYASRISDNASSGYSIPITGNSWYYNEFKEFCDLLNGESQTMTYEEFSSPVFIMNAIERSLKSGLEEPIGRLEI